MTTDSTVTRWLTSLRTYNFAREEGQKSVNTPTALSLWRLLLPDRFIYLDQWIAFVESKNVKSIPRDTWVLLHDFAMTIAKDLSKYSDDGKASIFALNLIESPADGRCTRCLACSDR